MEKRKDYKVEPTIKQKKYLDIRLEQKAQGYSDKKEAAKKAGFAPSVTTSVKANVEETKGFQQLLKDKGLDDATLLDYLSEDLKNKPRERLGELKLAFETTGLKENKLKIVGEADEGIALLKRLIDGEKDE